MRNTPSNLHEIRHPLVQHKLSLLRQSNTVTKTFKELVHEISIFLAYEATQHLPTTRYTIETPLETTEALTLKDEKLVILPILRAGIGMVDGFLTVIPSARVGHIGLFRDETTLQPECYFFKIPPNSAESPFFVCDPMLATGGSAIQTIDRLKLLGIHQITFICLLAAPEGIKKFHESHPDVPIYTASVDRQLNTDGYILPGLGDAGDRLFGTK